MIQQLDTPCKSCPFARENNLVGSKPGGSDPRVYIGQAWGPFLLACHMDPEYVQNQRSTELVQCAGAAIFRANCDRAKLMPPEMLHLPADKDKVFATPAEMLAHYRKISLAEAERMMAAIPPIMLMAIEVKQLQTGQAQLLDRSKIKLRGGKDGSNG